VLRALPHDREKLLTFGNKGACVAACHHVSAPLSTVSVNAWAVFPDGHILPGLRGLGSNEIITKGGTGRKPVHRDGYDLIERS